MQHHWSECCFCVYENNFIREIFSASGKHNTDISETVVTAMGFVDALHVCVFMITCEKHVSSCSACP